ncbi:MAG: hypothetical protein WCG78_06515 [Candidatus Omnitrophota bacterium]
MKHKSKNVVKLYTFIQALLLLLVAASCAQDRDRAAPASQGHEKKRREDVYEPGGALLEVFKADSIDGIADLEPVITMAWLRSFACRSPETGANFWQLRKESPDAFLAPERVYALEEVKPGAEYTFPYVARLSFYLEVKDPGVYVFTLWHGRNTCEMIVADTLVAELAPERKSAEGRCTLVKGFQRVVFLLVSDIYSGPTKKDPYFQVLVRAPNAAGPVPVTRQMMFSKAGSMPGSRKRSKTRQEDPVDTGSFLLSGRTPYGTL